MSNGLAVTERPRVPDRIVDLVCSEAASVVDQPELVLELWSELGEILPRALGALGASRGVALRSDPEGFDLRPREHRESDPRIAHGCMADGPISASVVVGVLPWRWAPEPACVHTGDEVIDLVDDRASVALLRACWMMPTPGVAAVIVGPGFVARRSPNSVAANLGRLGLRVINAHTLDRGLFRPASGRGRILLVLGHQL